MVMPYAHLDRHGETDADAAHELMDLAQLTERALEQLYRPHGFNFGMNLGQAAGAGVAGHLHLHAMPRWIGDTNFMTRWRRRGCCRKTWGRRGSGCAGRLQSWKNLSSATMRNRMVALSNFSFAVGETRIAIS